MDRVEFLIVWLPSHKFGGYRCVPSGMGYRFMSCSRQNPGLCILQQYLDCTTSPGSDNIPKVWNFTYSLWVNAIIFPWSYITVSLEMQSLCRSSRAGFGIILLSDLQMLTCIALQCKTANGYPWKDRAQRLQTQVRLRARLRFAFLITPLVTMHHMGNADIPFHVLVHLSVSP